MENKNFFQTRKLKQNYFSQKNSIRGEQTAAGEAAAAQVGEPGQPEDEDQGGQDGAAAAAAGERQQQHQEALQNVGEE